MAKKTSFQEYWLSEPQFKYIGPLENNKHYAKCSLCSKTIYLSNMGRGALISHINSRKHVTKKQARDNSIKNQCFANILHVNIS